jgi:hypothetical protein
MPMHTSSARITYYVYCVTFRPKIPKSCAITQTLNPILKVSAEGSENNF